MRIINDFLNLLFPPQCNGCEKPLIMSEKLVCTDCIATLSKTNHHLVDPDPVAARFYGKINILETVTFLNYHKEGLTSRLLQSMKYGNCPELGVLLGSWFAHELLQKGRFPTAELIVPVPMHKDKFKKRGYNQSEFIAKGMAQVSKIPLNTQMLIRTNIGETQARQSSRIARWENVKRLYGIDKKAFVAGRQVLLVDDVLTTGATLEACALPLIDAGCKSVSVASLAVAM